MQTYSILRHKANKKGRLLSSPAFSRY